jgi:DNA/RNA-binding domain of Phe-tRNA-synthetase-like protein
MKKFVIEKDFVEIFPDARIGIVLCRGIDNRLRAVETYQQMIELAEIEAKKHLTHEEFSSNEAIKVWREAFQKFKTKKGVRSSIEALLKRVQNGNPIGSINPLVDLYNCISLKYGLPCGGEDIATFVGDVRLTLANGDEDFIPLGTTENSPPYPGEVVYKDDQGAICRCWNWRESYRTMLTEETKDAFMCLELVDPRREDIFIKALSELALNITEKLGGTTQIFILDANNREIIIES